MTGGITAREFHAAEGVEDWRVVGDGACTYFPTGSFTAGARLVQAIAELPGLGPHQPDVDLRHQGVTVRLITVADDWYGMSARDLELARQISAAARDLGLSADPSMVQSLGVIVEGLARPEVMPFWRAVLGYEHRADSPAEDLVDPRDRWPWLWFEDIQTPGPHGAARIHLAVWVPPEDAEARVAAAIAAGGHLVRDVAPSWWTLADAEGHEVDVATVRGRD
jgi:4a-hydroxytetrahydrobiopterin dehydratase